MAYAFQQFDKETMTRAMRVGESISTKASVELCNTLRGMRTDKALTFLDEVIAKKRPVRFTRFMDGVGHRKGPLAAGRYPVKTAGSFKQLIVSALANAENKGLGTPLKIINILAQEASRPVKYGRKRGRQSKRTNIEVVLVETEDSKRVERKPKKGAKKVTPKIVSKIADAPEEKKVEKPEQKEAPKTSPAKPKAAPAKPTQSKETPQSHPTTGAKEGNKEKPKSQSPKSPETKKPEVKKDGN
ncbi:50S ribosomal protein L22 [Candidatus Woesearchaeota archaeon]|nr:50S ribosomal protein L22 [Candidatus Woesearchaeota archaeon]